MTFDAFTWEPKHTKALILAVFILIAVVIFHKDERRWLAGVMGVGAAAMGFL